MKPFLSLIIVALLACQAIASDPPIQAPVGPSIQRRTVTVDEVIPFTPQQFSGNFRANATGDCGCAQPLAFTQRSFSSQSFSAYADTGFQSYAGVGCNNAFVPSFRLAPRVQSYGFDPRFNGYADDCGSVNNFRSLTYNDVRFDQRLRFDTRFYGRFDNRRFDPQFTHGRVGGIARFDPRFNHRGVQINVGGFRRF